MQEFSAKKVDLDLELTTLSGDVRKLSPPKDALFNGTKVKIIANSMKKVEAEWQKSNKAVKEGKSNSMTHVDMIVSELELIYPNEKTYFIENFDVKTLNEILTHVSLVLAGYQKNSLS